MLYLGSHLPVFEFPDVCLRGVRGGEVQIEVSSMWVGAGSRKKAIARCGHSRDLRTRRTAKAAMWRQRAVLVLVAVCWFRDS